MEHPLPHYDQPLATRPVDVREPVVHVQLLVYPEGREGRILPLPDELDPLQELEVPVQVVIEGDGDLFLWFYFTLGLLCSVGLQRDQS